MTLAMTEMTPSWQFGADTADLRLELDRLAPDRRLKRFRLRAPEVARWISVGGLPIADVADRLTEIGLAVDLDADTVQSVVADAVANPAETVKPISNSVSGDTPNLPSGTPWSSATPVPAVNIADFLSRQFPPRQTMLFPWLPTSGLAMIYGPRGIGKTMIAHGAGFAIAAAGTFLKWTAVDPYRVLLIDGEMPREDLQRRLKLACTDLSPTTPEHFRIAAADLCENGLPDLSDPKAQVFYEKIIADADLVIVDNISTLCRSIKENDADTWLPVQMWALGLRRAGKSVLFVHHAGKAGNQRGTSRKEDVLDTVIALRRPPDYSADQGARFEVVFEKARGFHGPDAAPFEARLIDGRWVTGDIKAGDDEETLKAMKDSGLSLREIEERTGVPRSTVSRKLANG